MGVGVRRRESSTAVSEPSTAVETLTVVSDPPTAGLFVGRGGGAGGPGHSRCPRCTASQGVHSSAPRQHMRTSHVHSLAASS